MGGAERTERKRRQQEAARKASAGTTDTPAKGGGGAINKRTILIAVAVCAVAALVVGGWLWTDSVNNATEGEVIPAEPAEAGTEKRDGVVVTIGDAGAPVLDVYADFLCPACQKFEQDWGGKILGKANEGELKLRVHMVPMLAEASDPPGYSMDAANASLCAADEGQFTPFHASLFAAQPDEGARGWDNDQLVRLGRDLGITGNGFAECVKGGQYNAELDAEFAEVKKDSRLHKDVGNGPQFGTPTVVGPSGLIDWSKDKDKGWLDSLTS